MRYPVTLTPDDGAFTVTFPDVPEAITFGDTREEALKRAPDALLTIFDALIAAKRPIPTPSNRAGDAVELPALECAKIELYRTMLDAGVGKAKLARMLNWHLPQVDRVLKVRYGSHLSQVEAAFSALGKRIELVVVDEVPIKFRRATNRPLVRTRSAAPPKVHPMVYAEHGTPGLGGTRKIVSAHAGRFSSVARKKR